MQNCLNNMNYVIKHFLDTKNCYKFVKHFSKIYWTNNGKKHAADNYRFDDLAPDHSLGNLLLNNGFQGGYTIVLNKNKPLCFGGIRKYDDEIAIIGARGFSFFTVKPVLNGILIPFHIQKSKELGFKKAWVTINDYNLHWYKTWYLNEFNNLKRKTKRKEYIYSRSDICIKTCKNLGKKMINYVEQTVLEWNLIDDFK